MSEDSLKKIAPTLELSSQFLCELTTGVDCKNPKDILFSFFFIKDKIERKHS